MKRVSGTKASECVCASPHTCGCVSGCLCLCLWVWAIAVGSESQCEHTQMCLNLIRPDEWVSFFCCPQPQRDGEWGKACYCCTENTHRGLESKAKLLHCYCWGLKRNLSIGTRWYSLGLNVQATPNKTYNIQFFHLQVIFVYWKASLSMGYRCCLNVHVFQTPPYTELQ